MRRQLYYLLLLLLALFPAIAVSQNTISSISGTVKDIYGNAIEAANIQVSDCNTGSVYGAASNQYGIYSVSGLKPGEYAVQCTFIGYNTASYSGIVLKSATVYKLDIVLDDKDNVIDDVVITAKKMNFSETRTGQTYHVNSEKISLLPSVSRSLLDYVRLSPYNGIDNSMAGRDGRTTHLTIDGAVMDNSMGLSADLPGAGTPVSLDVIQEMQVAIAPYDVRQSDFTGGGINVITKSGTNDFKSTVYSYFHNQNLRGNRIDGDDIGPRDNEHKLIYGLTVGGPVVRNKLFYFVNLERESSPAPITEWKLSSDGIGNSAQMISRVTQADMDAFSQALAGYGYNAGGTDLSKGGQTNDKILTRIDWNISDNHNLMLRYNRTGSTQWFTPNARSTVGPKAASERISQSAYAFLNNCYTINDIAWSGVAELNSSFNVHGNLGNRLLVTISEVSNKRGSESSWFPHVDIMKDGDAYMSAGYELFSNGTGNNVRTYSISDNISWTMWHSSFILGASYQYQKAATNYRQFGTGYYRYASLQDFIDQARPVAFGMTYAYDDTDSPESTVCYAQTAVFMQAETRITSRFNVTYGIRSDVMRYLDLPRSNQAFKSIDWTWHFRTPGSETGFTSPVIDTGVWPDRNVQWSPRFGFNWNVIGDNKLVMHGGAGTFRGRIPMVFLTYIPNSSGMLQNTVSDTGSSGYLDDLAGNFLYTEESLRQYLADHGAKMQAGNGSIGTGASLAGIDKDFRLPSVLKTSMALDFHAKNPFPISAGIEAIFNKDIVAVYAENWNQVNLNTQGEFNGWDNRKDFHDADVICSNVSKSGGAMVLKNTNKGYSWSFAGQFAIEPVKNLKIEASYIHTEAYAVSDMAGSSLYSTWSNTPNVNSPNEVVLRPSAYVVPDRLTTNLTYSNPNIHSRYLNGTEVGLYYNGYNAGLFSYTYSNDMNGDGVNNDLIWIPRHQGDVHFADIVEDGHVVYSADEQQEQFWKIVLSDNYLNRHKGQYAKANSARMPWLNRFDLHLAQSFDLGGFNNSESGKYPSLQLSVDIMNVGNMLNSSWGVVQSTSACNYGKLLSYVGNDSEGEYQIFQLNRNSGALINNLFEPQKSKTNCWFLQLGVKLIL